MVVSSVYLRLFIFFLAILIPACISSCLAFCLTYSAYKLNKQGDNIKPWHSPFLIWNQSIVPCPVLTVDSWPVYRFLRRHIRWSGTPNSLRIFHRLLWSTQSEVLAFQDGWVEGCELIFSCEDSKTTTCCWTNIDRRVLDSPPKKIPYIQGQRRSPSKMGGGAKSHLDSSPLHARDSQRAQISLVCTRTQRPHRDWARTVFECLLWRYGSAVACPMNLLMDFTSSTLDTMFSLWLRKEWDLPFLHRPGPRIHGIHQIRDSVDKEASHLASFLTRLNN